MSQNRTPAGVPTGGQFAQQTHSEAELLLDDPDTTEDRDWGDLSNIGEGSRTPWGPAQAAYHTAPGIVQVSCAGHGGVKLSPERNREIPPALRNKGGWYEEDCEAYIVGMHFPEAFPTGSMTAADHERSVKHWFPDEWEQATGGTIKTGESRTRDEAVWRDRFADREIVTSAINIRTDDDQLGDWVAVSVSGPDGERVLKVPSDVYSDAHKHPHGAYEGRWVAPIDHDFADITPQPDPPAPPKPTFHRVDFSGLTDNQRAIVDRDMDQRWRSNDGSVRTLSEVIESDGLTGKTVFVENGRREYHLVDGQNHAYKVSAATWGTVEAPDSRSPDVVRSQEAQVLDHRIEAAMSDFDFDKARLLEEKRDRLLKNGKSS